MTQQIDNRVSGDTGPDIVRTLSGTGSLTSVSSITAYITRHRETTVALPAVVSNPALRQITTNIGGWLATARSGDWKVKYRVTFTSTAKQTWESDRPDIIRVGRNPAS
jgi:hypothetical protein